MTTKLQKIIKEELSKYLEEQQADKIMRKNVDQHQKILIFLNRQLGNILNSDNPSEELQNMTNVVLKSDTPTFLSQILKVDGADQLKELLPSLVKSLKAINPSAVKQYSKQLTATRAIVEKGIKASEEKLGSPGSQKTKINQPLDKTVASVNEGSGEDLPFLVRDPKRKHDKKHPKPLSPPNLEEKCDTEESLEELFGKGPTNPTNSDEAMKTIQALRGQANKLQSIYSARLDQGRTDAANQAKSQMQKVIDQIGVLKQKFSIQEEATCSDEAEPA